MNQLRRLRHGLLYGAAVLLLATFVLPGAVMAAQDEEEREYEDLALTGDNVCTRCHDDADDPNILKIGRTKHGTRSDPRTPTCTSCHGESRAHLDNPDGGDVRPVPDVIFTKNNASASVADQNAKCVSCHKSGLQMFWAGSTHEARDVACVSCHTLHTDHDNVVYKPTQPEVCFGCHKDKRAQINKPSRHPIREGMMACSDCHNPHGSAAGNRMLKRDSVVDTCFQCHMEKRGPNIWNHQPVTEDCTICHNPHGTTVPKMLKARLPFLCQQCHEPTSHRGRIPEVGPRGGGGTGGTNVTMARGCTNCHTNVHGGNSPTDSSRARALFR